jgi:DNA mismatch repair protein MutS2
MSHRPDRTNTRVFLHIHNLYNKTRVNAKHLSTLELPKILERVAAQYCAFSASADLARDLTPSTEPAEARRRIAETQQAREALEKHDQLTIGGARDVRQAAHLAAHAGMLEAQQFLEIRDTLNAGRNIQRALSRFGAVYPQLTAITNLIEPNGLLVTEISRCIDDSGEVRDSASPQLASIRREVRVVHDRLLQKLQRLVGNTDNAPYLQEALVTQRGGRYVIPIKSDFKGRIPGLIHDQSSSGMTLFIEPLATLEDNNRWRELQLAEDREVRKVLTTLSAAVGAEHDAIVRTVEAIARFDLALAKAKYAHAIRAVAPEITNQNTRNPDKPVKISLQLTQARHPLLNPDTVVPIDVAFEDDVRILVITGPNTGGKTVAMKTVGLLSLMAACGLHVPAESAALPVFDAVYADIGDEQSIEQSLSTYSAHLTNLRSFLDKVDAQSLVLLDELGAGTDPTEGAAIARALLEFLVKTGAMCVVATHYPELKAWASLTPTAVNANVAFDYETLRPMYRLTIGLPGRSNAFAIAQRLGIPNEILDTARGYLDSNTARAEDILAEIARLQDEADAARVRARQQQHEAESNAERIRTRLNSIEDERRVLVEQARADAEREVETLRAEVRRLRQRVIAAGGTLEEVKAIESQVEQAVERHVVAAPAPAKPEPQRKRPLQPGDIVRVRSLNSEAEVGAVIGGEADVLIGRMRMRVKLSDVDRVRTRKREEEPVVEQKPVAPVREASPGMELDIRGMMGEEGAVEVDGYLDRAQRAGLPFVRIIHGKGTGALRRAVRESIKKHSAVKSFETGAEGEGGDGVTVVKLNI